MSGIEELQKRVVEAEKRFGLINEQRSKYSERLVGLIDGVEGRLRDQQAEIERRAAELAAQGEELESRRHEAAENQALRGMLHSLLRAIEAGSRDVLSEAMQSMDAKVSALIAESVALVPARESEPARPAAPDDVPNTAPALDAREAEDPTAPAPELTAPELTAPELTAPGDSAGELSEAEVADLLGESGEAVAPETAQEQGGPETPPSEDEPPAEHGADLEAGDLEAGDQDTAAPELQEALPENGESDGESIVAEDEMAAGAAIDDMPDAAEESGAAEEPGAAPAIDDLVQEEAADPNHSAIGNDLDDKRGGSSLEDIMRRVSKLVEEEGALGPLATGSVRIGAGAPDDAPPGPDAGQDGPAEPAQAISNG